MMELRRGRDDKRGLRALRQSGIECGRLAGEGVGKSVSVRHPPDNHPPASGL